MASAPEVETNGKKNPWNLPSQSHTKESSLAEVMSEQLASALIQKDLSDIPVNVETDLSIPPDILEEVAQANERPLDESRECEDDLLIAQMLQIQFDKEYDTGLGYEERHHNGRAGKVTVSLSKYRIIPDLPIWDESEDEEENEHLDMDDRKRPWDSYEEKDKQTNALPRCGFKKVGNEFVTKHNEEINHRTNGKRIMEFPPGIETGDGGGIEMQLSNAVYNKIRNFSIKEGKRKNRINDKEDKSTSDQAMDPQTRILLFKMVNNGVLERLNGIISTGKEAVIMHAEGGTENDLMLNIPKECAVKIFKTTLNEFKTRDKYIKDDYRFKDRFGKQNPRKIVHIWAEKELHNLLKMKKFGLRVPEPVVLKKHVLVMSFIGSGGNPAPKLKDAPMSQKDLENAHEQVVAMMKQLYGACHLVHADLSEYNILWHEKECWLIDVSQSVEPNHPHGLEFLMRDCSNVVAFFTRRDVDCGTAEELFTDITGLDIDKGKSEAEIIGQIRNYQKDAEILSGLGASDKSYPFDYCWDKVKAGQTEPRAIPGHPKSRNGSTGKSPKSPKSFPPPSARSAVKSPKNSFAGLSDAELKKMKDTLAKKEKETNTLSEHEATKVTFVEK